MRNENFNKSQQKENLKVNVYQKDEHRGNSQKNPLMAAVVKMLLSGLDNGTECSFNWWR